MTTSSQPPPSRLGRFSVIRRLGVGGMAEVFLARSRGAEGVDKHLVVKRILPDYSENPHFRTMFVDEARVALRLNHPNVVQVYGFENDGATLLLIMEHVDGADLGNIVQRLAENGEVVPPSLAAYILREVARGLHYAHERADEQARPLEIVHRDVSPNNILLSYEGAVKIGDFGIARVRTAALENPGTVRGKFGYMAPEQALGQPVDRRADVYSLGVLLTELLSGKPLFHNIAEGADILERVRAGKIPSPEKVIPNASEALRAIASRAMHVNRDERFPSARDVSHALSRFLHDLETPADAGALEHFLSRALPQRHSSIPPENSLHPQPLLVSGQPLAHPADLSGNTVPGTIRSQPSGKAASGKNLVTLPALLMPEVPAPRVPQVDREVGVRERVHVVVMAGRLTRLVHSSASRALVHLLGELAFKADATLEWRGDDGFTLVIGVLRPHVDDALRAARLALEIQDTARSLAADVADETVEVSSVMLGMARGVAGCARDIDGNMLSYELVDDAASLAGTLASAAQPGEILLAGALYRIVRRSFLLSEYVSSKSGSSLRAFVLERQRSRSERDRSSETQGWRLIGREVALRELRNALVSASVTRTGRAVVITGELGIGKTTVLGAFATALVGTHGILGETRVVRVDGSFGSHGVRYGFAAQVLRGILALWQENRVKPTGRPRETAPFSERVKDPPPLPSRLPPPLPSHANAEEVLSSSDHFVAMIDGVAERYGQGPTGRRAALRVLRVCLGFESEEPSAEAVTTRELGVILRHVLADIAREKPVTLLLDALEQADPQSRAVVSELVRKSPNALVLTVVALRDDDPMARDLAGMPTVALGPLELDARRKVIANALNVDEPSDDIVQEISSVAGGNPLTILEVSEALGDRIRARAASDTASNEVGGSRDDMLPPSLEEVLTARLEALSPEARKLLRWCSICEAELTAELVDMLAGDDGSRVRTRLMSDGILVRLGGAAATVVIGFAHPLMARVARASIEPTLLPAMHARVVEILDRRKGAQPSVSLVAAMARHREAAGANRPAARSWLDAASMYAQGAATFEHAVRAYGRVLVLCRDAADVEGFSLRAAALEGREDLARASGAPRARRTELLALRELVVEAREPKLIARALTRQARYKLETHAVDADRDAAAAVRTARRAGESRTEAEARWVLAVHRGRLGSHREALSELDGALKALDTKESFGKTGESDDIRAARSLRIEVLLSKASLMRATGETSECVAAAAEAFANASVHGPRRLLAPAYEELGMACLSQGGYVEALRFFQASVGIDRQLGGRDRIAGSLLHGGQAWSALGQAARALAWVQRARDVWITLGRAGTPGVAVEVYVTLAELLLDRGDVEGASDAMGQARSVYSVLESRNALYWVSLGDARLHLARKQYRQARSAAEAAERATREAGMMIESLHGRVLVAEANAGQGDRTSAKAWLDSVLGDPHFSDPMRVFRGDRIVASCAQTFRMLGDLNSADILDARHGAIRAALVASAPTWVTQGSSGS
jgi:eukaryotic-like serine/threonine-protein kinase